MVDITTLRAAAMDKLLDKINDGDVSAADLIKLLTLDGGEARQEDGVSFVLKLVDGNAAGGSGGGDGQEED